MSNLKTIKVEIQNITEAQAITLETMFALWSRLGRVGSCRWVSFMADGDGNFRPTILVNEQLAKESELVGLNECIEPIKRCITKNGDGQDLETPIWNTDPEVYFLDFDKVAWKLHDVVS